MKKGIHIVYLKKQNKSICHHTTFYSIFNMSSCRKLEIQNYLPKITQIKWICYYKKWSKILCWFYHFNNCSIDFYEIEKIKCYASGGIQTCNPWVL